MPIFDFVCDSCGSRFERLVIGSGERGEKPRCPDCGSGEVRKQMSRFAVGGGGGGKGGGSSCSGCSGGNCASCR